MRSLLIACGLGGLGALLQSWNTPGAGWVSGAGALILMLAFVRWLRNASRDAQGRPTDQAAYLDMTPNASPGSGDTACSADGGGCDGGD